MKFREQADVWAKSSIDIVYHHDGPVRAKLSSHLESALRQAHAFGVEQGATTILQLQAEVQRLEAKLRAVGHAPEVSHGLATLLDVAMRVADQVAGEDLREIWWAKHTRAMVVVSAAQEDSKESVLQAEMVEGSSLWVAVASPGDMIRLRNGELELPSRFALPPDRYGSESGVVLEKLYP